MHPSKKKEKKKKKKKIIMISDPCVGIHLSPRLSIKVAAICIHALPSRSEAAELTSRKADTLTQKGYHFFLPRAVSDTSITPDYDIAPILPPHSCEPVAVHLCHIRTFPSSKGSSCLSSKFFFLFFRMRFLSFLEPDTEKPAPGCLTNGLGLQM